MIAMYSRRVILKIMPATGGQQRCGHTINRLKKSFVTAVKNQESKIQKATSIKSILEGSQIRRPGQNNYRFALKICKIDTGKTCAQIKRDCVACNALETSSWSACSNILTVYQ